MSDAVDYLNDPLLDAPEERPRAPRTPLLDRASEVLERINAFIEETGAEPVASRGRSVRERMLANELAGLRASVAELAGLDANDSHGLLSAQAGSQASMTDPLLVDDTDIFTVRDTLKPKVAPDYVADRRPCPDFERFAAHFDRVRLSLEEGSRKPVPFHQERVEIGEFFILKGQLLQVADVRDEHPRNGKPDARLRVVFDNETESNLLMSSLIRRLYEDKDAQRVGATGAGPLFEGVRTGCIYVVRSRSTRPEVRGLLKVGTTAGTVEDRVARAESQGAFLFSPVEILDTYELKGYSAKEAEKGLHQMLRPYHVALQVTGPDGRAFAATEWFKVDRALVDEAVTRLLSVKRPSAAT